MYSFFRPITALALKVFFRRIYISGVEGIPMDAPVIFTSNHPTAFTEPCLLACFQPRTLHFLVRGDFFKKWIFKKMLQSLNMIPVFRFRDGFKNLKNNEDTFRFCYEALSNNQSIMILVEGTTKQIKKLRPIKKGTARIVLGFLERYGDKEIYIVPIGANFTNPTQFRSHVLVGCRKPLTISSRTYGDFDKIVAVKNMTEDIQKALRKQIVHIENEEDTLLIERLLILTRNNLQNEKLNGLSTGPTRLRAEMQIAEFINSLDLTQKERLSRLVNEFFSMLEQTGLSDKAVLKGKRPGVNFWRYVLWLISFPGLLLNFLPLVSAKRLVDKKVKMLEFYGPVKIGAGLGFYIIYLILVAIILAMIAGLPFILATLLIPFTGWITLIANDILSDMGQMHVPRQVSDDQLEQLKNKRKGILSFVL